MFLNVQNRERKSKQRRMIFKLLHKLIVASFACLDDSIFSTVCQFSIPFLIPTFVLIQIDIISILFPPSLRLYLFSNDKYDTSAGVYLYFACYLCNHHNISIMHNAKIKEATS
jgi:hypothetical protein